MLSHDPGQRPRSARAVIKALETSLTLPRPQIRTIDMRPLRRVQRRRLRGALLGLAILIAAVVVGNDEHPVRPRVPQAEAAPVVRIESVTALDDVPMAPIEPEPIAPVVQASPR